MMVMAMSPFYFLMHGEAMSHTTTALFLVLAALCFLSLVSGANPPRSSILFLGGLAMGIAFACRPLTAASHGVVWLVVFVVHAGRHRTMSASLSALPAMLGFGGVFAVVAFYHYWIFGDPFTSGYRQHHLGEMVRFGFFQDAVRQYTPAMGFQNIASSGIWLWVYGTGWPIGGMALLVPWMLRTRLRGRELLLVSLVASQVGFYFFYHYHDLFMGPRFWYECLPFVCVLAARGLQPVLRRATLASSLIVLQIALYSLCGVYTGLQAQKIRVAQMTAPHQRFGQFIAGHLPVTRPLAIVLDDSASELFGSIYPRIDRGEAPLYFIRANKLEEARSLEELRGFEFVFYEP